MRKLTIKTTMMRTAPTKPLDMLRMSRPAEESVSSTSSGESDSGDDSRRRREKFDADRRRVVEAKKTAPSETNSEEEKFDYEENVDQLSFDDAATDRAIDDIIFGRPNVRLDEIDVSPKSRATTPVSDASTVSAKQGSPPPRELPANDLRNTLNSTAVTKESASDKKMTPEMEKTAYDASTTNRSRTSSRRKKERRKENWPSAGLTSENSRRCWPKIGGAKAWTSTSRKQTGYE